MSDGSLIAGIGFINGCPSADIETILERVLTLLGAEPRDLKALAIPAFKIKSAATVLTVARNRALALIVVPDDALAAVQDRCPTRSKRALAATGFASVAEAAALAAAGAGACLLFARITFGGATCALSKRALIPTALVF